MDEHIDRLVAHFDFLSPRAGVHRLSGGSNGAVYRIGDYVVKISTLPDAVQFEREGATMDRLRGKIHVPRLFVVDTSRELIPRNFLIQSYVPGTQLARRWDDFSVTERRTCLRQICDQIREVHALALDAVPPLPVEGLRWYLDACARRGVIPKEILAKFETYLDLHGHLACRTPVVTHGDLQFYNIIFSEDQGATYFIDFGAVFAAAPERDLLPLACTAFSYDAASTHYMKPQYADNLRMIREACPEWFDSPQAVETMRLFSIPRVCYTFDAQEKSGFNPQASEPKGRLLCHLYFEDPVWEAYMRGEPVSLS
jgi:aminoglycoside phosphotransferase (APT) family kinase protein